MNAETPFARATADPVTEPASRPASTTPPPGTDLLVALRGLLLWSGGPKGRGRRYLAVAALGLAFIWGLTTAYIVLTPESFRSHLSLILPGNGVGTSVNLESIGQASSNAP